MTLTETVPCVYSMLLGSSLTAARYFPGCSFQYSCSARVKLPSPAPPCGLPWDTAIQTLQDDLTGAVATAISVIAFLAAGGALVFGEDVN